MYGPTTEIFDKFFEEKEGIKKEYEKSKLKEVELPVGMSPNMNSAYDKIASVSIFNTVCIFIAQSYLFIP